MVKYLALLFTLIAFDANAAAVDYKIIPAESSIGFTAVQNGSNVGGNFSKFSGTIKFAPDDLANSSAKITIEMASVTAAYTEVPKTLKEKDWFDVSAFPSAVFESTSFKKIDEKNFEALGNLTIKGIKLPVTLKFTLDEFTPAKAVANGTASLSRTKYKIGWSDTSSVQDAVKIQFKAVAGK